MKIVAIVLAAGKGSRMHAKVQKQYLELLGKPLIAYTLDAFEASDVDEVILVTGEDEIPFAQKEIVSKYGYRKISKIVRGGQERYESVYHGLCAGEAESDPDIYVLIHDGARAFITPELIRKCIEEVIRYKACVMAVSVKDTIKIVDEEQYAVSTPDRKLMWQMQTPQCFVWTEIREVYRQMTEAGDRNMTDDAMVMEKYGTRRVKMTMGSYNNIKITTPEDLILGESILRNMRDDIDSSHEDTSYSCPVDFTLP
ncbi:MAG: 2-C-methyl-D-erythritol 4-phosphate cytidylyltransferase [Clostridiales bacterium]|nr:2-C-methyl-D-erythritol 4-phosphate cytidylyltransferase [Clostridiales bacterium]